MQAYFESKQAFSISMPHPVFEISIAYKKKHVCKPEFSLTADFSFFIKKTKHNHSSAGDW